MDWSKFNGVNKVGMSYYPLHPEIINFFNKNPSSDVITAVFGGSDPYELSNNFAEIAIKYPHFKFNLICGRLTKEVSKFASNMTVYTDVCSEKLYSILSQSIFSIITYGVTLYETNILRVPAIVIGSQPDHKVSFDAFSRSKQYKFLELPFSENELTSAIDDMIIATKYFIKEPIEKNEINLKEILNA
jgi:spore coat polysaccharide biosynthesis predicted glycosyltransferase SpsG